MSGRCPARLRTAGRTDTWTVRGLTFTLQSARFARGRWGGTYLVTAGRVTFKTSTTGTCTATSSGSFSLGRLKWDAASISFLQNLREPGYAYGARVLKEHPVRAAQCAEAISPAGGLWLLTDVDGRLVPGKRLAGHRTERSARGTRMWAWNLVPRS